MSDAIDRQRELYDWLALLEQESPQNSFYQRHVDDVLYFLSGLPPGTSYNVVKEAIEHQPWFRVEERDPDFPQHNPFDLYQNTSYGAHTSPDDDEDN